MNQSISLESFGALNYLNQAEFEKLTSLLAANTITTWILDGEKIIDELSLYEQAKESFPWPVGRSRINGWDSFSDFLWGIMVQQQGNHLAVILKDAHLMLNGGLETLFTTTEILLSLSRRLNRSDNEGISRKRLSIFLVGEGSNFPMSAE